MTPDPQNWSQRNAKSRSGKRADPVPDRFRDTPVMSPGFVAARLAPQEAMVCPTDLHFVVPLLAVGRVDQASGCVVVGESHGL
jgi:hypothetical protein